MRSGARTAVPDGGIPFAWWRHLARGLSLCVVAGVVLALYNVDLETWSRLKSIPLEVAPLLLLMVMTAWACNGFRTFLLARAFGHSLSLKRAVAITLSMEFAIAATPGGLGGLPTRILLQRRSGIPVHQSLTMVVADASTDLLFFLCLFPFALGPLWEYPPVEAFISRLSWEQLGKGVGILLLFAGLARLFLRPLCLRLRWSQRIRAIFSRVGREYRHMRTSARWLWRHGRGWYLSAFLFCGLQWTCRYGILPVILWALDCPIDPLALVYLQGTLFVVALLVVVPGGGGSLELLSTWILQPVAGAGTAALAVIGWRVFTYYLYILGGGVAAVFQLAIPAESGTPVPGAAKALASKPHDHVDS